MDRLLLITRQLKSFIEETRKQYDEVTIIQDDYKADFFGEVKPFADQVHSLAKEWKELSLDWIKNEKPKYVYPPMIENTYDNITIISVQAFYKDTRSKRFHKLVESIFYVLDAMEQDDKMKDAAD